VTDPVIEMLGELGLPVTRQYYIDLNWSPVPDPWTPDDEAELPEELQDWTRFEMRDGELVAKRGATQDRRVVVHIHDDATWSESDHPRVEAGSPKGGQFTKGSGGGRASSATSSPQPAKAASKEPTQEEKEKKLLEGLPADAHFHPFGAQWTVMTSTQAYGMEKTKEAAAAYAKEAYAKQLVAQHAAIETRRKASELPAGGYVTHTEKTDPWNRALEKTLDGEYAKAKPALDKIAADLYAGGDTPPKTLLPLHGPNDPKDFYGPKGEWTGGPPETADVNRTNRLAFAMQKARTEQLLVERGVGPADWAAANADEINDRLWTQWKESSSNGLGALIQLAVAEEFGGRLNAKLLNYDFPGYEPGSTETLKYAADKDYEEMGGYAGIRAAVRATWETSQWMLDQAGIKDVAVYRAVVIPNNVVGDWKAERVTVPPEPGWVERRFYRYPEVQIARNGALSTTTDERVANNWQGVTGEMDAKSTRVVLRVAAPASAVVSLPAFGKGFAQEHELVLAGTSWNGWDAWQDDAPPFEKVPCCG
jgi:hypothetical protein